MRRPLKSDNGAEAGDGNGNAGGEAAGGGQGWWPGVVARGGGQGWVGERQRQKAMKLNGDLLTVGIKLRGDYGGVKSVVGCLRVT